MGWRAHELGAAQHGCRLDLAPRGTWSTSSRCSWWAAAAPGPRNQIADPGSPRMVRGRKAKAPPSPCCEQTHGSSAVPGTSLLQDESPGSPPKAPPAPPGRAGCSAQPWPRNRPRSQPASRSPGSPRSLNKAAFPNGKNTPGKEKQKAETTRKTPLSLSQGADAIKSPALRDGKGCTSSPHPPPKALRGTKPPVAEVPCACPRPLSQQAPHSWDRQAGIYGGGGCPAIVYSDY